MPRYFQGISDNMPRDRASRGGVDEAMRRRIQSEVARGVRPAETAVQVSERENRERSIGMRMEEAWADMARYNYAALEERLIRNAERSVQAPIRSGSLSDSGRHTGRITGNFVPIPDEPRWLRAQSMRHREHRFDPVLWNNTVVQTEEIKLKPEKKEAVQLAFTFPAPEFVVCGEMQPQDFRDVHRTRNSWTDNFDLQWLAGGVNKRVEVSAYEYENPELILMKYNAVMAHKRKSEEKKNVRTPKGRITFKNL